MLIFYAERVWDFLEHSREINALEMENYVAELADLVIIVVESAGTIAELGAFAGNANLRKKLLPICDVQFKTDSSFINSGPLSWVNAESVFSPVVYSEFRLLIDAFVEVEERAGRIRKRGPIAADTAAELPQQPKRLLLLLTDLIAIIGPATESQCRYFIKQITGLARGAHLTTLLGLGVALNLFNKFEIHGETYFHRPLKAGFLEPAQTAKMFALPGERARMTSALQTIPAARAVLDEIVELRRTSLAS